MDSIAFLGLGTMGGPMAGHLVKAGFPLTAYNRSAERAQAWQSRYQAPLAETPAEAAASAHWLITCVGRDADLEAVLLGSQGAAHGLPRGATVIDHSTVSANMAQHIAATLAERGIHFLDAPVSGGQAGAERGQLSIMVGGPAPIFEQALPILRVYGKTVERMGEVGSGQRAKMVNQICIAGILQSLAEALNFAEQAELDIEAVLKVITQGAAASWQMQNRSASMLQGFYDHGFAVDWMRKDLGLCLDEAERIQAPLPVTALVDQFYADVQNLGGGRWDTSSLLVRLQTLRKKS
ncbi:MAG: NAD(P)-dependent oxidoreductase [Pseudomonadales bacterium]|nr:NAD(P)-dependent oxidoreductase [Pseudomonadales bacterium]